VIRTYLKNLEASKMQLLVILLIKNIWGCWLCLLNFYVKRKPI